MKTIEFTLTLILILASCSGTPLSKKGRIVGGEEFPYLVSLQANGNHICGGSIISNNFVLTVSFSWNIFHGN
jgi:hypothetical protein